MKSFLVLRAAVSLAFISAADCDLTAASKLLADSAVKQRNTATGLSFLSPPSVMVLPKLCGNKSCRAMLPKIKKLGDCTVLSTKLQTDFVGPIEKYCK